MDSLNLGEKLIKEALKKTDKPTSFLGKFIKGVKSNKHLLIKLFIFVITSGVFFITFLYTIPDNPIYRGAFAIAVIYFVVEQLTAIGHSLTIDDEKLQLANVYQEISKMLLTTNENIEKLTDDSSYFTVFANSDLALEYCIKTVPLATEVKNAILRYGNDYSFSKTDPLYNAWFEEKKRHLQTSSYPWRELVSSHLAPNDKIREFIDEYKSKNPRPNYFVKFIDDKIDKDKITFPLIQTTIFDFNPIVTNKRNKEVIFGWEFPGRENGPCFKTNHKDIVIFFEKYFDYYFKEVAQENPNIVATEIKQKFYINSLAGVWLYLVYDSIEDDLNDVYGVISITEIEGAFQAHSVVSYFGKIERGKWNSFNISYDENKQKLKIDYDMIMGIMTPRERKMGKSNFSGVLQLNPESNKDFIEGFFKDSTNRETLGKTKIIKYSNEQNSINETDLEDAFRQYFKVNIKKCTRKKEEFA